MATTIIKALRQAINLRGKGIHGCIHHSDEGTQYKSNIYKDLIDETIPPESPDMQYAEATAYCLKGTCADGTTVRDGICASKPEYIGKTIIVYDKKDMSIIGYFECTDTGSEPIRDGDTIDIWIEEYQDCKIFGRKQICYQVLDEVA